MFSYKNNMNGEASSQVSFLNVLYTNFRPVYGMGCMKLTLVTHIELCTYTKLYLHDNHQDQIRSSLRRSPAGDNTGLVLVGDTLVADG